MKTENLVMGIYIYIGNTLSLYIQKANFLPDKTGTQVEMMCKKNYTIREVEFLVS